MNDAIAAPPIASEDNARIVAAVVAQGPRLRAFIRRQVADWTEVEDIVQETFLSLVAAHRLMEPIEHLSAWLKRVARNRIIDRYRKTARTVSEPDNDWDSDSSILAESLAGEDMGPEACYAS